MRRTHTVPSDAVFQSHDSLGLTLLVFRMIILEDDLEKLMVSKEPVELTYEGYQDLSDRLHQLQPHMQASTGCWEDTVTQVERMLRRASPGELGGETNTHQKPADLLRI